MNVAVFIKSTTLHPNYGGLETQNKILCEGLVSRGHKVTVFSLKKANLPDKKTENGVRYIFIPASYKYFFASLNPNSWERKSAEVFGQHLKEEKFDLVLSQSTGGIGIIIRKDDLDVKVVSIAHGTTVGELKTHFQNMRNLKDLYWALRNTQYSLRQYFGRQRQYILGSDKVIAVSQAVKKQILDETFAPEELIAVIPNGVDPAGFPDTSVKNSSGNPVKMVFTSRVIRSKGIFDFLKILPGLDNVILDIIGDGEDREEFMQKAGELKLQEKINFSGKVSHPELLKRLSDEDIFVLPTYRFEGFPMTVVESMLAGLPSIVYDLGGVSDAVEDGKTGYLVNPGDVNSFTGKIKLLAENPELRVDMGRNARQKALNEFTIEIMLNKYEKVFEEVLK